MATIKNLTVNKDYSVTLVTDTGDIISMSSALSGIFCEQYEKIHVRDQIRYAIEDMDGDIISMGSYDGDTDDFIEEVYSTFEDEIKYGNHPTDEDIKDAITDTAEWYGILIDD